jgi:3-oxoacyl-[acyl-carrier protein] reductase
MNTGGPPTGMAIAHEWSAWEKASELLLRSAVELTRAFIPGMRERKWGRVIGITSFAVKRPVPSLVLSNAMRAAVTGYYRTLADEVAIDGVTVNTVLPGYTETERLDALAAATVARSGIRRLESGDAARTTREAGGVGRRDRLPRIGAGRLRDRPGDLRGRWGDTIVAVALTQHDCDTPHTRAFPGAAGPSPSG